MSEMFLKPKKDKHSNPSFLLSHTWRKLRQNGSNPTMISNYETFRDSPFDMYDIDSKQEKTPVKTESLAVKFF